MTLTDKQKQDIEKEAEKYWPAAVAFGEKARRAYIAGATAQLLALNRKDEEIARLKDELNNIKSRTYTHAEVNKMLLSISSKCDEEIARLRKAIDRIIFRVSITGMLEEKSVLVQAINEIESIATEALKQ